ncbi:MAG: CRISPR-associated endonuclease Cas2 [Methanobrevibacter sp.]|jgi:CRISPR-associated protein Cas2|nr:CRISPR-associated endonuclease Cas2 [Candidatus Methanoflexus mossambicus]
MLTLVTYDISENKNRTNLIKYLRHFGLYRLQKSVFAGDLNSNDRDELSQEIEYYLSGENDSILIFPLCDNCKGDIEQYSEDEIFIPEKSYVKFV